MVLSGFSGSSLPGGDDSNDSFRCSVTVADNKQISLKAEPQDDESLFIFRVFGIVDHECIDILKNRRGF